MLQLRALGTLCGSLERLNSTTHWRRKPQTFAPAPLFVDASLPSTCNGIKHKASLSTAKCVTSTASTRSTNVEKWFSTSIRPHARVPARTYANDAKPENKAPEGEKPVEESKEFATNSPQNRDEIVKDAKSFMSAFQDAVQKNQSSSEPHANLQNPDSVFSKFRTADRKYKDIEGMTPRQESIPNAEMLRSASDLKVRRNTVLRKTLWYSLSELLFDWQNLRFMARNNKLMLLYILATGGLIVAFFVTPSIDYDFFGKKEFEEKQKQAASEAEESNDGVLSSVWNYFGANFSIIEPFKKIAYVFGGGIVGLRMLHALWFGDPLSEDERLIAAHTPISLAKELRPDEYHHVPALTRIMATGHIPVEPWTALIPPSPWAPHLTLVVDVGLLYSVGFNQNGQRVMRKRPFADYFLASLAENAEIILSSDYHSKASAKGFFKLFDPYGAASHTFTAEDHRWDGVNWLKPLEERYIGRKPERLLVLDSTHRHCGSMCANVLRVAPWNGNASDTTFLELTPVVKYMAAGVEEGIDPRQVIRKYEGNSSAKDIIREYVSYTGQDVPMDNPLEDRLREKYAKEDYEPVVLTDEEWGNTMERLANNRTLGPFASVRGGAM